MRRIRVTGGIFIRGGIVTCLSRFQGPRSVLIPTSLRLSEALRGGGLAQDDEEVDS